MITVIIPTCDRPSEYLREAINSVFAQSLAPSEIIIVDNGTRDADPTTLTEGLTLYRLPPRVGPSRARNFAAAMAKGTHLAFLDDDDWWDADFLREAWAVLQSDGVRCVYGRIDRFRNGQISRYKCPSPETMTIPVLLRHNPGAQGQNLMIEKTLFWRVGGFDERLRTSEDKALAIEVLQLGERIAVATEAVAIERTHMGVRARDATHKKFKLTWKYRRHFSLIEFVRELARISKLVMLDRLRMWKRHLT